MCFRSLDLDDRASARTTRKYRLDALRHLAQHLHDVPFPHAAGSVLRSGCTSRYLVLGTGHVCSSFGLPCGWEGWKLIVDYCHSSERRYSGSRSVGPGDKKQQKQGWRNCNGICRDDSCQRFVYIMSLLMFVTRLSDYLNHVPFLSVSSPM